MKNTRKKVEERLATSWLKYERIAFWGLTLIILLPVLSVQYFYTGDGPAHLYNANIISRLLTDENSAFAAFYHLRAELIPNMGGHVLLSLFKTVFTASVAEKLVYFLCLILLPLSFRFVVKVFTNHAGPLVFLVFLLVHNFCFYIGFQSFSLGLAMMLFSIGVAKKALASHSGMAVFWWAVFLFATAIFHLFAAVIALLAASVLLLLHAFHNNKSWRSLGIFALAALPTLLFFVHFLWHRAGAAPIAHVAFLEKLGALYATLVITVYNEARSLYAAVFSLTFLLALFVAAKANLILTKVKKEQRFALITSLLLLGLYFLLPDKMASGGFISIRLLLCFLLFLALWGAMQSRFSFASFFVALLVIGVSIARIPALVTKAQALDADAKEIMSLMPYLKDGNTLVPLNYSDHWLHYNIALYLGAEKEVIVLDNYEASTNHFPVMWDERVYTDQSLGDVFTSNRPTLYIRRYEEATGIKIDAVVRWKHSFEMKDAATRHTDSVLNHHFKLAYFSPLGSAELYLRKE